MINYLKVCYNISNEEGFAHDNERISRKLFRNDLSSQPFPSVVRSVDIANEMGFKKSSVSVAMKNLRENGYILVSDSGFITLTDSGMEIAEMIYERHTLLSTWLETLGVDKEIAAQDACKMEHVISKESFDAIKRHIG